MNFISQNIYRSLAADPSLHEKNRAVAKLAYPLTLPDAPRLSHFVDELGEIERSCVLSNYGPVNEKLQNAMTDQLFGGLGPCLTVANATLGLMLSLKEAAWRRTDGAKFVIMSALTFAAAAHAVLWAGLVPVLVDVDADDWTALAHAEDEALDRFEGQVAAVMPYATFGRDLDLKRYDAMADRYGISIVIDAASSLGTQDARGLNFGAGSRHAIVFSMHATKAFGVGEGGLIHSGDEQLIARLRRMGGFGLDSERSAVGPGLNSKMCEVSALAAYVKLPDHDRIANCRNALAQSYRDELPGWQLQGGSEPRRAYQFMPTLLPPGAGSVRAALQARMSEFGVGTGRYFSPHIGQQPYFRETCVMTALPTADDLAARLLSLPMHDRMTVEDVRAICGAARRAFDDVTCDGER